MDNEQYIESGLSVGTTKIANNYEIFTEEEVDAINNKIPELDERVGVIEDEIEEINSSLDDKANISEINNKVWHMANMGQDIKEAMTGGSVAVVGTNAVGNENIKNKSINRNKLIFNTGLYDIFTYVEYIYHEKIGTYDCKLSMPHGTRTLRYINKNKLDQYIILESEYTLIDGQYLVWNLTTNSTIITSSLKDIDTEDFVVLAYCRTGEICYGILKPIIDNGRFKINESLSLNQYGKVLAMTNSTKDIYLEYGEDGSAYIYFSYIFSRFTNSLTWQNFKLKINDETRFVTSPSGKTDCLLLRENEMLMSDYTIIDYFNNPLKSTHFPMLTNYFANVEGSIIDCMKGQTKQVVDKLSEKNGVERLKNNVKEKFNNFLFRANSKITENSFNYLLISDIHFYSDKLYSYNYQKFIRGIENNIDLSVILDCGDTLQDGVTTKELMFDRLIEYNNNLNNIHTPYIGTVGNHDCNAITNNRIDNVLTNKERHSMFSKIKKHGGVFDKTNKFGNYFYYDDDENKVRYISLNCHDIPFVSDDGISYKFNGFHVANYSNKQLNWVCNVALNLEGKEDYLVIPIGHSPLDPTGIQYADAQPFNSNVMFNIFKAFVEGTSYSYSGNDQYDSYSVNVDFKGKKGIIPVHHFGHTHHDNFAINTFNMYNQPNLNKNREKNLTPKDEFTFTLITVDKTNRKIYATRHGYGEDSEFSY